ncbi:MAG: hypothetical protein AAB508_06875 [Patescibacteria group bacterium]
MFTPADKKFLKDNFATKNDLKRFATKDDLKNDLASMEKRMDTKFATKDDLTSMEKRMDKKFASKDDLIIALKDQKEQILDAVDGKLAKQKEEIVREVGEFIADTVVPIFDKHDRRLTRVEKKLDLPFFAD